MKLADLIEKFKQYPWVFSGAIVAVICLALIYFRGSRADEFEVTLQEKDNEWSHMQSNLERSKDLQAHVERMEGFVENINGRLMNIESVAINYEFFYDLERRTEVNISTITQMPLIDSKAMPQQLSEVKDFNAIPYTLVVKGGYNEIMRFIYMLERDKYIIRLDSFNLSKEAVAGAADGEAQRNQLTARIECYVLGVKNA